MTKTAYAITQALLIPTILGASSSFFPIQSNSACLLFSSLLKKEYYRFSSHQPCHLQAHGNQSPSLASTKHRVAMIPTAYVSKVNTWSLKTPFYFHHTKIQRIAMVQECFFSYYLFSLLSSLQFFAQGFALKDRTQQPDAVLSSSYQWKRGRGDDTLWLSPSTSFLFTLILLLRPLNSDPVNEGMHVPTSTIVSSSQNLQCHRLQIWILHGEEKKKLHWKERGGKRKSHG